jgi:hypothetical protein
MVKIGVSDRQQAPPSYPFARPEQRCGFSMEYVLDQEFLLCNALQRLIYKQILSLELNMLALRNPSSVLAMWDL